MAGYQRRPRGGNHSAAKLSDRIRDEDPDMDPDRTKLVLNLDQKFRSD
eukprot:SAG31_NODE_1590_length_7805_cov_3.417390_1_plen_48_part_00